MIYQRLKEARNAIGYSHKKVAELTGLSINLISLIEQEQIIPSWSELSILADIYKVTTDFLLGDKPMEKLIFLHCKGIKK